MMKDFQQRVEREVKENILQFWMDHTLDREKGGFYGKISNDMVIDPLAPKGLILNTRILWAFSRAYNFFKTPAYLETARRAYKYLIRYFWDHDYEGMYWLLDAYGAVLDSKKQTYGQGFAIYALAEYYRATRNDEALELAKKLYQKLEHQVYDAEQNGYFESFSRAWEELADQEISPVDMHAKKSMNTHLHLLEAYARLYKEWQEPELGARVRNLIDLLIRKVLNPKTFHFFMFFDKFWTPLSDTVSFGHDIEGAWLIYEAAELLNDKAYLDDVKNTIIQLAESVYRTGLDGPNGKSGVFNEQFGDGTIDPDKVWWVQTEACVGFMNAYQLTGKPYFLETVYNIWNFIQTYCVDHEHGEWFWFAIGNGVINNSHAKVEEWKAPYHNSRACIELLERANSSSVEMKGGMPGEKREYR